MRVQSGHFAASSSPMYGGGPRWGTNDLALMGTELGANDVICALSPIPAFPAKRGRRRCHMQLQYWHMAASSSPMYGGGARWGTNDLALMGTEVGGKRRHLRAVPHPSHPPRSGEGDAATCRYRVGILQHLPPPCMGEDRGGGQTTSHLWGPSWQTTPDKNFYPTPFSGWQS